MQYKLIILLVWFFPALCGQSTVTLKACLDSAILNHPRVHDKQILENISKNSVSNYDAAWLPEISLNGQATYQSDVIGFDVGLSVPGFEFPTAPKDQYKMYIDVRQTLYDAGKITRSRELEGIRLQSSLIRTETEIEVVKPALVELFYTALALQQNSEILSISREQLKKNLEVVHSSVKNGLALPADADLLSVEMLDIDQEIINLEEKRAATVAILSSLTGMKLSEKDNFEETVFLSYDTSLNRKELLLFDQNKKVLAMTSALKQTSRLPVAFAFGQLGYGNPGLNMLNDEFDSYYYVGLGLKWSIWDWNVTNREKANLMYQSELIDNQKNEFVENIERAKINQIAAIRSHEGNISRYTGMLVLREGITSSYESRLREGTIRTIDYISVINQERILRIRLNNEKILLQKAIAGYLLLTGNLNHQ